MANPVITISPTPPSVGDTITITYSGRKPITLTLDWDPPGSPTSVVIPAGNAGGTVVVPPGATSLIVGDPSGAAAPTSTTIN